MENTNTAFATNSLEVQVITFLESHDTPVSTSFIAESLGEDKKAVFTVIKSLLAQSKVQQVGIKKGSKYQLVR